MKTRSERNAEFIANIDNLSTAVLRVACYKVASRLPELNDISRVISALKAMYDKQNDSWIIDDLVGEYNRIAGMSEHNLQVWDNYRRNNNADQPNAKVNGNFIEVKAESIRITIDGNTVAIDDSDFVSIHADYSNGEDTWASVSFAAMEKMV